MAAKSSKRARVAAQRGDAGVFDRLRATKIGSEILEPTLNAFGKSSELQASRLIDRRKRDASGRLIQAKKKTAPQDPSLRGAKPNPLPTGAMEAMSQLAADRSRDRRASEETGMAADLFSESEEPPLLELPARSYARPEETAQETEMKRQRGMERTMRQFIGAGALNEEQPQESEGPEEETPLSGRERTTASAALPPTGEEGDAADEETARAADLDAARQQDAASRSASFTNAQTQAAGVIGKEYVHRLARLRIRAMIASGVAGAEAIFPLLGAALLSFAWIIGSRFSKTLPPPKLPDYATFTGFCAGCSCGCIVLLAIIIIPFALLASAGPTDLLSWGLESLQGLFQ